MSDGVYNIGGSVFADPSVPEGVIRVVPRDRFDIAPPKYMRVETYRLLQCDGRWGGFVDRAATHIGEPFEIRFDVEAARTDFDDDAASDLRTAIALGFDNGDGCVMPGCLQDPIESERDFVICAMHDAMLADVDDLLTV